MERSAADPAIENRVGPYLLLQKVGSGGMGEVFLARDSRLHRRVALKCLFPAPIDADAPHARILHEARAAARINHSNVAAIHDVIEEHGRTFIVMEFVEGESLAVRMRRAALGHEQVVAIARQLAAALAAAHGAGMIHRDLKPANVQITPDGTVKVLDFGIAQAVSRPVAAAASASTVSAGADTSLRGRKAGTPEYMAPEQLLGEPVDERSDLYSLGIILYELITGRRPYHSADVFERVPLPATLSPRVDALNPSIPRELADVVDKALRCDKEARFQSAQEFDAALAAVQQSLLAQRRRRGIALIAVAAAALVAVAAPWFTRDDGPRPLAPGQVRSVAVLPFLNLSRDPAFDYLVDGMTDGVINALGRSSALRVTARTSVMALKGAQRPIASIARDLNVDVVIEGSVQLAGSTGMRVALNVIDPATETQLWSTTLDRDVKDFLSSHVEIARAIIQQLGVAITEAEQGRLANVAPVDQETQRLYLLGRFEWNGRTLPQLQRALQYFEQAIARSPLYAPAYAAVADTYVLLAGDFAAVDRDEAARQAIAHATRALDIDPDLVEAHSSLGFTSFFLLWDWSAAEEHFKRALQLNSSYATAHQWYGNFLSDIGREDEALVEMRRALDIDPLSPIISRDVAWPLFFSRRYDEAVAHLDTTLTTFAGYAPAERLRARSLAMRGDVDAAVREFEVQKGRADNPRTRCELAWAYALAGRRADAEQELASALSVTSGVYFYDVALVLTALGRRDDALSALERAFDERDATMVNLKHDPRFDALRADPRFDRLLTLMRFP